MDEERIREDEHALQFFGGVSSSCLIFEYKDMALECIKQVLDNMESVICKNTRITSKEQEQLHTEMSELYEKYVTSTDVVLKKYEPTIRALFTIPKNVPLPENESVRRVRYSEQDVCELKKDVLEYEQQYLKEVMYLSLLKQELKVLEELEPCRKEVGAVLVKTTKINKTFKKQAEWETLIHAHEEFTKVCVPNSEFDRTLVHEKKFKLKGEVENIVGVAD